MVNKMAFDNVESGRKFAMAARAILAGDFSAQDSTSDFELEDMLKIADRFNIFGAFNCVRGSHWRLVLEVNEDGSLEVYDPLFDRDGVHIYTFVPPNIAPPNEPVTMPSRPLLEHYKLPGSDLFQEDARLRMLRENGYRLNLPQTFEKAKLQHDSHNCGPLVLYAALVADKYTPEFADKPKFTEVRAATGVEII